MRALSAMLRHALSGTIQQQPLIVGSVFYQGIVRVVNVRFLNRVTSDCSAGTVSKCLASIHTTHDRHRTVRMYHQVGYYVIIHWSGRLQRSIVIIVTHHITDWYECSRSPAALIDAKSSTELSSAVGFPQNQIHVSCLPFRYYATTFACTSWSWGLIQGRYPFFGNIQRMAVKANVRIHARVYCLLHSCVHTCMYSAPVALLVTYMNILHDCPWTAPSHHCSLHVFSHHCSLHVFSHHCSLHVFSHHCSLHMLYMYMYVHIYFIYLFSQYI